MKTKSILMVALGVLTLAGCADDDFVGYKETQDGGTEKSIRFAFDVPTPTRAVGAEAAATLGENFVVFGYKTVNNTPQTVFNNYQVNYVANTAYTTTSNSADWEYVGYKNLPVGVSTNVGVRAFSALTGSGQANETAIDQTIKYWDYSATQYDFFAYSLGAGYDHDSNSATDPQYARTSALTNSTYTIQGSAAELGACYISNKKTMTSLSTSTTEVELEFLSFLSKIELKFYETIPGYSVKDVKFYPSAIEASSTTPYLYTSIAALPTSGKYTITFDTNGKPQLALAGSDPDPEKEANISFSSTLTNYATKEYKEASGNYLGRTSTQATSTDLISVLPNPANDEALNLKMDFTLVSRDGSGEDIHMTGATAVIPAAYAEWKPNYKYTYIFKISDDSNAQSGAITGLYPITLDAVVADAQDGTQETITTVSEPSITTYAKGEVVTANNEYLTNSNIYVVVDKDGTVQALTVGTNAKLYLVTNNTGDGTEQTITEASVANALAKGTKDNDANPTTWTVTGANMKNLIVTTVGVPTLTATTSIPVADSPTGVAISVNCAWFKPTAAGTYAFEYSKDAVGTPYVAASGTFVSGTIYYTDNTGSTEVDTSGFTAGTDVTSYFVVNNSYEPAIKAYKVIKVVAP